MAYSMGELVRLRNQFFEAYDAGDIQEAIHLGNDMMEYYQKKNLTDGLDFAGDAFNLAVLYDDISYRQKAAELYLKAAQIQKRELGEESEAFTNTLNNLAVTYSLEGRHTEALSLYKKVLRLRLAFLEENHPDVIIARFHLGTAYENLEKNDRAVAAFEEALHLAGSQPALPKKDYADILCGLASVLGKKGCYKRAISHYAKAVEMLKIEEGEHNFYYLSVLLSVALLCEKAKCYDQAVVYYKRAIASRSTLLEKKHLDYVSNLNALAQAFLKRGEFDRAIDTHKEALGVINELLGKDHVFYAECVNHIGRDYLLAGNKEKAMEYFQNALLLKEKNCGKEHVSTSFTKESIADCLLEEGKEAEAKEAYAALCQERRTLFGETSEVYLQGLMKLGACYEKTGDLPKAVQTYQEAMEVRKEQQMPRDMGMVFHLQALAEVLLQLGNEEEAMHRMNDALVVRRQMYGRIHPRYARGLYYRGKLESKMHRLEEGRRDFLAALSMQKDMVGEENQDYKDTVTALIALLKEKIAQETKQGNPSAAADALAEVLGFFTTCTQEEKMDLLLQRGMVFAQAGRGQEGLSALWEIKERVEKSQDVWKKRRYQMVQGALLLSCSQYAQAEEVLVQALEEGYAEAGNLFVAEKELLLLLGETALLTKNAKKAESYFTPLNTSEDEDAAFQQRLGLGRCAMLKKDWETALALLGSLWKESEGFRQKDPLFYHRTIGFLSEALEKRGETEAARRLLETVLSFYRSHQLQRRREYVLWLRRYALLAKKEGLRREAAESYRALAQLDLEEDKMQKAADLLSAGRLWMEEKEYPLAEEILLEAKELLEEKEGENLRLYRTVLAGLKRLYTRTKQVAKAEEMAQKMERLETEL